MVRDAIYATMLKSTLKRIHSRIAECIEGGEHWLPGERLEALAHHFSLSNEPKKAVAYLLLATKKAVRNFANEAVIFLSRQSLDLMQGDPSVSSLLVDNARLDLATALKFTGEFTEASDLLMLVIEGQEKILANLNEQEREGLLTLVTALRELGDIRAREGNFDNTVDMLTHGMGLLGTDARHEYPFHWRRLADRLAWVYFRITRLDEAYNLADLVLLDYQSLESDDPTTLASVYNTIGGIYWSRSRIQEAIESVEHSLEIYRSLNYHWGTAIAQTNLGVLCFTTEKWQKAVQHMEQADRLQSECGYVPERSTNLKNLGEVLIAMGDFSGARSKLETSREISEHLGMWPTQVHAELALGRLSLMEGKATEASHYLDSTGLLLSSTSASEDLRVQVTILEALVEVHNGNYSMALEAALRAQELNTPLDEMENEIEILRILGIIRTHLKDFEQAEADLVRMLDLSVERKDHFAQGRGMVELGRLYKAWSVEAPQAEDDYSTKAESRLDQAI